MTSDAMGPEEVRRLLNREIAEAEERRSRWPNDTRDAMSALCTLFPSLRGVPGTTPWNADALLAWLCGPAPTSGSFHAAKFVLGVWNSGTSWGDVARDDGLLNVPPDTAASELRDAEKWLDARIRALNQPFDVFAALNVWDRAHADAFKRWVDAPFWP